MDELAMERQFSNPRLQAFAKQSSVDDFLTLRRDQAPPDAAVVDIDKSGSVANMNQVAEKLFQRTVEEMTDKNVALLCAFSHRSVIQQLLDAYTNTRNPRVLHRKRQLKGQARDGSTFTLSFLVQPDEERSLTGRQYFYVIFFPRRSTAVVDVKSGGLLEGILEDTMEVERAASDKGKPKNTTLVQRAKFGLFNVLTVVLKKGGDATLWFTLFKIFVDFVQMGAFLFYEEAAFPWRSDYVNWLVSLVGIFLVIPIGDDLVVWALAFALVSVLIIDAMFVGYMVVSDNIRYPWTMKLLQGLGGLVVEVLYMPVTTVLTQRIREADPSNTVDLLTAIGSGVFGVLFILFSLIYTATATNRNPRPSRSAPNEAHSRVKIFVMSIRTILSVFFGLWAGSASHWVLATLLLGCFTSAALVSTLYMPFYVRFFSELQSSLMWVLAWGSVCLYFCLAQDDPNDASSILAFFCGSPFVAMTALFLCDARRQYLLKAQVWKLSSVYDVEMKCRFMLQQVFPIDENERDIMIKFDGLVDEEAAEMEKKEREQVFEQVEDVYTEALRLWPQSPVLHIFRAVYFLYWQKNKHRVWRELKQSEVKHPSIDYEFMIFQQRRAVSEVTGGDTVSFLVNKQRLMDATKYDHLASVAQLMFWAELLKPHTSIDSLQDAASELSRNMEMALKQYEALQRTSKASPATLRMFASFLANVVNDDSRAQQLVNRADHIEELRARHSERSVVDIQETIFSEDSPVVTVGGEEDDMGETLSINNAITTLLGFYELEIVGRDVSNLLSPPYAANLKAKLMEFHIHGNEAMLKPQSVLGFHRDGHVVPVTMHMKEFSPDNDKVQFMIALQLSTVNENFAVIDADGHIMTCTTGCNLLFDTSIAKLQARPTGLEAWFQNVTAADIQRLLIDGEVLSTMHQDALSGSPCTITLSLVNAGRNASAALTDEDDVRVVRIERSDVEDSSLAAGFELAGESKTFERRHSGNVFGGSPHLMQHILRNRSDSAQSDRMSDRGRSQVVKSNVSRVSASLAGADPDASILPGTPEHTSADEEKDNRLAENQTEPSVRAGTPRLNMRADSDETVQSVDSGVPSQAGSVAREIPRALQESVSARVQSKLTPISINHGDATAVASWSRVDGSPTHTPITPNSPMNTHDKQPLFGPQRMQRINVSKNNALSRSPQPHLRKPSGNSANQRVEMWLTGENKGGAQGEPSISATRHSMSRPTTSGAAEKYKFEEEDNKSQGSRVSRDSQRSHRAKINRFRMLSMQSSSGADLTKFRRAISCSQFIVLVMAIVQFSVLRVELGNYRDRINIIHESGDRTYLALKIATSAQELMHIQAGIQSPTGPPTTSFVQSQLEAAVQELDMIDRQQREDTGQSQKLQSLWNSVLVTLREYPEIRSTDTVWAHARDFAARAKKVATRSLSTATPTDVDTYFTIRNANTMYSIYNISTFNYLEHGEEHMSNLEYTAQFLCLVSILVPLSVLVFVVMPSILRLNSRQVSVLSLFLRIPKHSVKALWLNTRRRIRQLNSEEEAEMDESIAQSIEREQEAYLLKRNTNRNAGQETEQVKNVRTRNAWNLALKVSGVFLFTSIYFVAVYLGGVWSVADEMRNSPTQMAWHSIRRAAVQNALFRTRALAANTALPLFTSVDATAAVTYLKDLNDLLLYGSDSLGIEPEGSTGVIADILFENACVGGTAEPLIAEPSDCLTWNTGIMANGLFTAMSAYRRWLTDIITALASPPTTTAAAATFFTTTDMQNAYDFVEKYAPAAFEAELAHVGSTVSDVIDRLFVIDAVLFAIFLILMIVAWARIYMPSVANLDQQIKQTQSMLLMLPEDIMKDLTTKKETKKE